MKINSKCKAETNNLIKLKKDIRKFIENYDKIKSHITDTMDECIAIIDMLQTQLASIDDEDFKNYLINIKMIDAPKN